MVRPVSSLLVLAILTACGRAPAPREVTVSPLDLPGGPRAFAPRLARSGDGIILSWLETVEVVDDRAVTALRFARHDGDGWGEAITVTRGDDLFANWADTPMVVESPGGELVAHWLRKREGGPYAYDVVLVRSRDGGATWTDPLPVHDDGTATEHGFVSAVPEGDGLRLFWLDGRETGGDHGHDESGGHGGAMTLRTAVLRDGVVGAPALVDDRVCDCCNTAAVATARGPLVLYRDRVGEEEIRDVSAAGPAGDGWRVAAVHEDGWAIAGCPVNGPAADARGNTVAAAWYSGAVDGGVVNVAFSGDGGVTFGAPVVLDATTPVGRVDLRLDEAGTAWVCWLDTNLAGGRLALRPVTPNGPAGPEVTLAWLDAGRPAGFPRLEWLGDTLACVWTDPSSSRLAGAIAKPTARE